MTLVSIYTLGGTQAVLCYRYFLEAASRFELSCGPATSARGDKQHCNHPRGSAAQRAARPLKRLVRRLADSQIVDPKQESNKAFNLIDGLEATLWNHSNHGPFCFDAFGITFSMARSLESCQAWESYSWFVPVKEIRTKL